jgi:uncharacterized protein (DUF1015 family)
MLHIRPVAALGFAAAFTEAGGGGRDISTLIAPPFDVLDGGSKELLLAQSPHNIVAVDLPHLPAKTVGPEAAYQRAGAEFRAWRQQQVLVRRGRPALFIYQQTYQAGGQTRRRRGLFADVALQPFGKAPQGRGGVFPHELTFREGTEDRLRLMRATAAQLSPVFGMYDDPAGSVVHRIAQVIEAGPPSFFGVTAPDAVRHEVWAIDRTEQVESFTDAFAGADLFIADGHHRYTTALAYREEVAAGRTLPADHSANYCLFVLVAIQDPGMLVLPTHRVLGGMPGFHFEKFRAAAQGKLELRPFAGKDFEALARALAQEGPQAHAIGLYNPADPRQPLWIATTTDPDPLHGTHPNQSAAWRQLDVAIAQHLIVEQICQPTFCPGAAAPLWKFPHTFDELQSLADGKNFHLGLVMQPTPLASVLQVSKAGELMPQKSTFFYPKLATGLVIHPLESLDL